MSSCCSRRNASTCFSTAASFGPLVLFFFIDARAVDGADRFAAFAAGVFLAAAVRLVAFFAGATQRTPGADRPAHTRG